MPLQEFKKRRYINLKDQMKLYNLVDVFPFIVTQGKLKNQYHSDKINILKEAVRFP